MIWKHLPANGVLLFFDEQLIAVKAYGGWRYTTAPQLILERGQKTRGRFYLFAVYEVNTGRRRWAFYQHKRADEIGQFMKQIRRWYPTQSVWVALDRDSTHPAKCHQTRRLMRQLKLHWVTLPKGSPDDNPVENIFSDLQLMVLNNSNDPDVKTTQRRISRYLQKLNRRRQRRIHIPYLFDSHRN